MRLPPFGAGDGGVKLAPDGREIERWVHGISQPQSSPACHKQGWGGIRHLRQALAFGDVSFGGFLIGLSSQYPVNHV